MRLHPFALLAAFSLLSACGGSASVIPASTVRKVILTGSATTLNVGDTMTLTATALDANGAVVSNAGSTIWTSSATTAATVNQSGKVTAVGAGNSVITADIADVKGTYSVKVNLAGTASRSPR